MPHTGASRPQHDRTRALLERAGRQLHQLAHLLLVCAAAMFVVCVALRWVLEDTTLLAVLSRIMPTTPTGVGRESLNAGAVTQILDMLTVALPALMVLLIAAGALHPASNRTVTRS